MTGDRRWRQEGFGDTGEAYLVGPDYLVRSAPRAFYENRDDYFAELKAVGASDEEIADIERYGTPVLHQRIDTQATRAALAGVEGTGEIIGYRGVPTLASWGPLAISGVNWALVAKIDTAEAFAPIQQLRRDLLIVGGLALLVVVAAAAWLSRALLGPLRELTAGVKRFAAGDYGASVPVRTKRRDRPTVLSLQRHGRGDLREKNIVIENKNRENEELLLNVLPAPIANRLRGGEEGIADGFAEVTVAFADLVGFTELTSEMPPNDVVTFLNGLFTRFDAAAQRSRDREDQDCWRRLHGRMRPARARGQSCRAHRPHGHSNGPHHPRTRHGAQCLDEDQGRRQHRAGSGRRHRQEQVHLRSVGRHREPRQPHGSGWHTRLRSSRRARSTNGSRPVRVRAARRDRSQRQGQGRGLAAEIVGGGQNPVICNQQGYHSDQRSFPCVW